MFKFSLTLLGYKSVGRATNTPAVKQNWLEQIKDAQIRIGIDTKIVEDYSDELKHINSALFTKVEGAFSMYIDATTMMMGPSSYCNADKMICIKNQTYQDKDSLYENQIKKAFSNF